AEPGTEEKEGEKSKEPEKEDIPTFSMKRRLTKSSTNKILTGVCGGIGEYFDIDPTLVRLAFVVLTFFNGIGIVIYIILAVIMPEGNGMEMARSMSAFKEGKERNGETGKEEKSERMRLLGAILLIIGIFLFLDRFHVFEMFWWIDKFFWPAVFTAAGAWLLLKKRE
ncbi:MAG: PspC domain-containing protein, partial [Methanosarcinaceae archaeon]|nr:PspC domain-containing protein [Methanosarcinaceae archaeon]